MASFSPRWLFLLPVAILGLIVATWCGLHQDEALFLKAIDAPANCNFAIADGKIALMIMPYVGTLKAALFAGYLHFVPLSPEAVRWPMVAALVLVGALSLRLWPALGSSSATLLTAALLLLHPLFIMPMVLDWGPVSLQLLLSTLALLAAVHHKPGWLGLCLGLMVWDKAVAVWALTAVAVAALVFYPARLRAFLTWPAAAGFTLGALPYLYYRTQQRQAMAGIKTQIVLDDLPAKLNAAFSSLDGSAILTLLFPVAPVARQWALPLVFAVLLIAGLAVRRRLPAFFWTAALLTIAFMMVTADAGGSIHHHLLAWPLIAAAVVTTLAALPLPRWATPVGIALLLSLQVAAWTPYFQAAPGGPRREWTDVTTKVNAYLLEPGVCSGGIYALDWGFTDNLNALGRGRYHIDMAADEWFRPELPIAQQQRALARANLPTACLLEWADAAPFFPGVRQAVAPALATRQNLLFVDRRRRPTIRLWGPEAGTR